MTEQGNVEVVRELYAAFGRGGPEEVSSFFARLAETLDIEQFAPTEFLAQADRVVPLGLIRARVKDTGRSYDNEWAMVWTLREGEVAGRQIYEDTARELAAHA